MCADARAHDRGSRLSTWGKCRQQIGKGAACENREKDDGRGTQQQIAFVLAHTSVGGASKTERLSCPARIMGYALCLCLRLRVFYL